MTFELPPPVDPGDDPCISAQQTADAAAVNAGFKDNLAAEASAAAYAAINDCQTKLGEAFIALNALDPSVPGYAARLALLTAAQVSIGAVISAMERINAAFVAATAAYESARAAYNAASAMEPCSPEKIAALLAAAAALDAAAALFEDVITLYNAAATSANAIKASFWSDPDSIS